MTIPNFISIARLLMVPVVVYALLRDQLGLAFFLFLAAGVSDGIDGFIARQFNQHSELGAYLDPVADKVLLVSVFVTLGIMQVVPDWLVLMVVARDVLIMIAVMVSSMIDQPVEMRPIFISKANTAAQIALATIVLGMLAFDFQIDGIKILLINAVAGLTAISGAAYLVTWIRHMSAENTDLGH